MVDTWVTVGSCAQIGRTLHLGGVGIGGVLEPLQAEPHHHRRTTASSAPAPGWSGVIVGENSNARWASYIPAKAPHLRPGHWPKSLLAASRPGSVVISGSLPRPMANYASRGRSSSRKVDAQTRSKTSINELLRA